MNGFFIPLNWGWLKDTVIVYDDAEITTQHSRMTYFVYWLRSILMVWVLDYNGQPIKNKFWSQHMLEWYIVLVCLGLKAALLLLLFFWSGMTDPCTSCGCGHGKCMWTDPLSDEEDEDGMMGQMRAPLPRGLADSRGPTGSCSWSLIQPVPRSPREVWRCRVRALVEADDWQSNYKTAEFCWIFGRSCREITDRT
eukprot:g5593.t1